MAEAAYRGLSDYWRVDRSSDRSRELASVLGGAATQAELVQIRLGGGRRRGRADAPPPVIIDPRVLSGFGAPVPSEVVDCVVGLAIHEAALRTLSVDSSLWPGWDGATEEGRQEYLRVHRSLEEVYLSERLARLSPTLVAYVRVMRRMLAWDQPRLAVARRDEVTREAVLSAWVERRLGQQGSRALLDGALRSAVSALDACATAYLASHDPLRRLNLAAEISTWLSAYPREPEGAAVPWSWFTESGWAEPETVAAQQMRANVRGGADAGGLVDLGQYLGEAAPEAAHEALSGGRGHGTDIEVVTAELREMGVRASVTAIKDARFDAADYERVRAEVAREIDAMRHVFSRLDDIRSRWRHGLRRGKIDGRSLTKLAAGKQQVFKLRERQHGAMLALVFLVDVSASMRSYMPVVNRAACVVSEALRDMAPRVRYEVLTYTSGGLHPGSPVQLTRLAATGKKLSLRDVWTDGGTPTGEAIAAALLLVRRRSVVRRLILHFTDGHPKDSYVVRQALELCRRNGVDVLTVSVGASQEALYGEGKCEVAYSVPELTSVLARLLPRLYR